MPYRDSQRARDYQREYRRLRRAGDQSTTSCTAQVPVEFRLKTAQDVLRVVEEQVLEVQTDKNVGKIEKARCIGYLAGVALRAIEAGNMASRIEALEDVFKKRSEKRAA